MTDRPRDTAGDVAGDMASSISRLVRQEMRAIGRELREQAGPGAGLLALAAAALLYAGGCAVAALVSMLARVLPTWLAAMTVSAALGAVAGLAGSAGLDQMRRALPQIPERAAADLATAANDNPASDADRGR